MAQAPMKYGAKGEAQLLTELLVLADRPHDFVKFVYPWGEKGTPLEHYPSPRKWQAEVLLEIQQHIVDQKNNLRAAQLPEMFREAIASGRGPGKSALVAWLVNWMMSTRLGSTSIVTANTEAQLKSRTWAELGKWMTLAINGHWFERTATTLRPVKWFSDAVKRDLGVDDGYWYAQAQLWSEETPDAFAGVHNPNGIFVFYDEASGIPAPIWQVTEGFFTEPVVDRYWLCTSNPRRNTGAFFECFHKHRDRWRTRHIDSRTVEGTDTGHLQAIVDHYGVDSDEARVEVLGQFPMRGENQLIGWDIIQDAVERELVEDPGAPLVLGVDVGRGGDPTVLRWRKGRDGRSWPAVRFKIRDDMQTAYRVAEQIDRTKPDAVCVDAGAGTGVIDRLRELGYKVHEVWFGSKSPDPAYQNQRTYMWYQMRDWLSGGCIDDDERMKTDLAGPEKKWAKNRDAIGLESKEDMKARGLDSPNDGDALALTFAVKVARKDLEVSRAAGRGRVAEGVDYAIFG